MARVYYIREGQTGTPAGDGEDVAMDEVVERFRGHRKVSIGPTPPALRSGQPGPVPGGRAYVVVEIGPEEVRPPEFLDIGFYVIG
jgi:hypothetical protein